MTAPGDDPRRELLAERLRGYHEVELDKVLELVAYLRDPGDTVLVGGSLAAGSAIGNGRSDLDVIVAGGAGTHSASIPVEHWIGRLRVDVWKRTQGDVDELFERAEERLASELPLSGAFGDVDEQNQLKFLHRIASGIVLDGPPLEPTRTPAFREVARDLVVREYAERTRASAFAARMALETGRGIAAAMNARTAVEDALNAATTGSGLPFIDNKWLFERLVHDVPELEADYRSFEFLPEPDGDVAGFVESALATCERTLGLDLSAEALRSAAAWDLTGLKLMKVGDASKLLSVAHGRIAALEPDEVRAWSELPGGRPPCDGCDDGQTRLCFELYAEGLARVAWSHGVALSDLTLSGAAPA